MADIRINDLPEATNPVATENVAIDGSATRRTTIQKLVDAGAPVASQSEAEAGENNSKRMTALRVKQSIAAEIGDTIASATAGALAVTALQPADVGVSVGDMIESKYDPDGKGQNVYAQAFRDDSPRYFGATGDGTTNDSEDYALAEAELSAVFLPGGEVFNLGSALPTKPVHGSGKLNIGGLEIGGFQLEYEADRANVFFQPEIWFDGGKDGSGGITPAYNPPVQRYDNIFLAPGSNRREESLNRAWRSTVLGVGAAANFVELERCEIIGNSAMRYAKYGERDTAIGTLSMQWLGQTITSTAHPDYWFHDLYWPVHPSDPSWDADGMATRRAAIRTELTAYNDWATSKDDVQNNVAVGRDSHLHLVKGSYNSAFGYRASSHTMKGDSNSSFGYNALGDNVWGSNNAAFGASAGHFNQTGNYNTYMGYGAGRDFVTGDGNVMIGYGTGWTSDGSVINGSGNVFIGRNAGRELNADTSNVLLIQNAVSGGPLISGNFTDRKIGVNTPHTDVRATLHVKTSSFGTSAAANVDGDDGIFESAGTTGVTIRSGAASGGRVLFADPDSNNIGGIYYEHSNDRMTLRTGGASRFIVADGLMHHDSLPTTNPGAGTKRFWVDTAAGNVVKYAV